MLINTGQNNTVEAENEGNMRFKFAFQWYGQPRNLAIFFKTPACCRTLRTESTIMDKSLGTNLHLWGFFTRAKQIHLHLFSPSPPPSYNVGHVYTLFLQSFNIVLGVEGGGEAKHF